MPGCAWNCSGVVQLALYSSRGLEYLPEYMAKSTRVCTWVPYSAYIPYKHTLGTCYSQSVQNCSARCPARSHNARVASRLSVGTHRPSTNSPCARECAIPAVLPALCRRRPQFINTFHVCTKIPRDCRTWFLPSSSRRWRSQRCTQCGGVCGTTSDCLRRVNLAPRSAPSASRSSGRWVARYTLFSLFNSFFPHVFCILLSPKKHKYAPRHGIPS